MFPPQESLLVRVPLQIGMPHGRALFGSDVAPTDVEDPVALVHNTMFDHIREHETEFRMFSP